MRVRGTSDPVKAPMDSSLCVYVAEEDVVDQIGRKVETDGEGAGNPILPNQGVVLGGKGWVWEKGM